MSENKNRFEVAPSNTGKIMTPAEKRDPCNSRRVSTQLYDIEHDNGISEHESPEYTAVEYCGWCMLPIMKHSIYGVRCSCRSSPELISCLEEV